MKTRIDIILIAFLLVMACTSQQGERASSLEDTRPKGQASVVDEESDKNILQVAISSEDHSTLVAAVEAAGIEHILVNAGPLTVFAPVNSAFDNLPPGTVTDLLKPENKGKLAGVLTKHAAPGSFDIPYLKKEAERGRRLYMADGSYLDITIEGEDVYVSGAKVLASVQTSNGIVNVVDKVIL